MDFAFSPHAIDLARRVEKFVADEVVPLETFADSLPSDVLRKLREKAKREGLWAPHLPRELGGQGVELPDVCPAFEAAGRSLLGPLCLGCAAPDEETPTSSTSREARRKRRSTCYRSQRARSAPRSR